MLTVCAFFTVFPQLTVYALLVVTNIFVFLQYYAQAWFNHGYCTFKPMRALATGVLNRLTIFSQFAKKAIIALAT